ncbi:hypothetical protein ACFXKR_40870 [Streptomyces violascens]|uniref:hypothetical protein n=1 Tax=Streptomyces violascens TaxID=67381 RepID=UPI0036C75EDE
MTDEAGVITSDLTIQTTRLANNLVGIQVQYTGADGWYTLTGSPVTVPDGALEAFHERVLSAVEHGEEAVAPHLMIRNSSGRPVLMASACSRMSAPLKPSGIGRAGCRLRAYGPVMVRAPGAEVCLPCPDAGIGADLGGGVGVLVEGDRGGAGGEVEARDLAQGVVVGPDTEGVAAGGV